MKLFDFGKKFAALAFAFETANSCAFPVFKKAVLLRRQISSHRNQLLLANLFDIYEEIANLNPVVLALVRLVCFCVSRFALVALGRILNPKRQIRQKLGRVHESLLCIPLPFLNVWFILRRSFRFLLILDVGVYRNNIRRAFLV